MLWSRAERNPNKPFIPGFPLGNCGNPGYSHCTDSVMEVNCSPSGGCPLLVSPTISHTSLMKRVTWGICQLYRSVVLCSENADAVGESQALRIFPFAAAPGDSHHQECWEILAKRDPTGARILLHFRCKTLTSSASAVPKIVKIVPETWMSLMDLDAHIATFPSQPNSGSQVGRRGWCLHPSGQFCSVP